MPIQDPEVSEFIATLYDIIIQPKFHEIVEWSPLGEELIIKDETAFTNEILHRFFRASSFASFVRQLNLYGFSKRGRRFSHQYFTRDNPENLKFVRRKIPSQLSQLEGPKRLIKRRTSANSRKQKVVSVGSRSSNRLRGQRDDEEEGDGGDGGDDGEYSDEEAGSFDGADRDSDEDGLFPFEIEEREKNSGKDGEKNNNGGFPSYFQDYLHENNGGNNNSSINVNNNDHLSHSHNYNNVYPNHHTHSTTNPNNALPPSPTFLPSTHYPTHQPLHNNHSLPNYQNSHQSQQFLNQNNNLNLYEQKNATNLTNFDHFNNKNNVKSINFEQELPNHHFDLINNTTNNPPSPTTTQSLQSYPISIIPLPIPPQLQSHHKPASQTIPITNSTAQSIPVGQFNSVVSNLEDQVELLTQQYRILYQSQLHILHVLGRYFGSNWTQNGSNQGEKIGQNGSTLGDFGHDLMSLDPDITKQAQEVAAIIAANGSHLNVKQSQTMSQNGVRISLETPTPTGGSSQQYSGNETPKVLSVEELMANSSNTSDNQNQKDDSNNFFFQHNNMDNLPPFDQGHLAFTFSTPNGNGPQPLTPPTTPKK